jgi:DNA polymerase-3 subunit epsilon
MRLPLADLLPHGKARYVVVDVETSGLDLARDSLIAIGAVAVNELALDLDDCFEIVLRQEKASAEAIEFLQYVSDSTLVAFRAEFDQTMLQRAVREILGTECAGRSSISRGYCRRSSPERSAVARGLASAVRHPA